MCKQSNKTIRVAVAGRLREIHPEGMRAASATVRKGFHRRRRQRGTSFVCQRRCLHGGTWTEERSELAKRKLYSQSNCVSFSGNITPTLFLSFQVARIL